MVLPINKEWGKPLKSNNNQEERLIRYIMNIWKSWKRSITMGQRKQKFLWPLEQGKYQNKEHWNN